jgi:hypothetical protein
MTEVEIGELLESDLTAYNLVVQAIQQDECLLVTLNRPADSNLDYTALTEAITARIKTLQLPGIHTLVLCSRVLGEYDVDWQTQLELILPQKEQASSEVEAIELVDTTPDPQEFKLTDYCFTRNKSLLTFDILPPSEKIASLIQFFHALPDSSKECILPILKPFLLSSHLPTEQFDPEVQQWFEQLTQLTDSDARTASIWFSRYCFNPEKTMAEVMAILEPETTKVAIQEEAIAPRQTPTTVSRTETAQKRTNQAPTRTNIPKNRRTRASWQIALPIGWLIFTFIAIALAVRSVHPSELVDAACRNAKGKQEYCRLAVQLVGELTFHETTQNAVPLTPGSTTQSLKNCETRANIQAGKTLQEVLNSNIPVLSSSGEEVLPGILIADVKQTNFKQAGSTIRTACVYIGTQTHPALLGTDVIPNSWPNEPYKSKPIEQESLRKVLGIHSVFISLGTGTLFTAIGIFIAAMWGLGVRVYSLEDLYKAAFCLGMIEILTPAIPGFGLVAAIAIESLALGLVSAVVKGFHIEWADGYPIVAAGTVTIIAVRYLLNWLLFGLIASLVH